MTTNRTDLGLPARSAAFGEATLNRPGLWPAARALLAAWQPPGVIAISEDGERNPSRTSGHGGAPRSLSRDPFVLLALGLLALASVPYLFPFLSTETMGRYAATYVDIPFLGLLIAATTRSFLASNDRGERRFWALFSHQIATKSPAPYLDAGLVVLAGAVQTTDQSFVRSHFRPAFEPQGVGSASWPLSQDLSDT